MYEWTKNKYPSQGGFESQRKISLPTLQWALEYSVVAFSAPICLDASAAKSWSESTLTKTGVSPTAGIFERGSASISPSPSELLELQSFMSKESIA